jgi:hydroxymethylbilane synthase
MSASVLRLGTRRSLLAIAQSSWVAREVERLNPGTHVQLVGIETRGDRVLDVPLSQIDGKEFFVAELDHALRKDEVDFCVHSLKDLSIDRPSDFVLAAIPPREDARDIVVFHQRVLEKLKSGYPIRIGTSSPRRLENIPLFLEKAMPRFSQLAPSFEWIPIRGNVNTRLGRIHTAESDEKNLDGVVLALAGLSRLWVDSEAGPTLRSLFKNTLRMVLPLSINPTAPGQGALAVECKKDRADVLSALKKLHHSPTQKAVENERKILKAWGGGCHQKLGATQLAHQNIDSLMFVVGRKPENLRIEEVHFQAPPIQPGQIKWDGVKWRARSSSQPLPFQAPRDGSLIFVAHHRAWPNGRAASSDRIWTAGVTSWFKLAERGLWIEGTADELGFEWMASHLQHPIHEILDSRLWKIFTHEEAQSGWEFEAIATYRTQSELETADAIDAIQNADEIYIASPSQHQRLISHIKPSAKLSCGAGKTAGYLKSVGLNPQIFPSYLSWKKWSKDYVESI